jgi:hypothetical protein
MPKLEHLARDLAKSKDVLYLGSPSFVQPIPTPLIKRLLVLDAARILNAPWFSVSVIRISRPPRAATSCMLENVLTVAQQLILAKSLLLLFGSYYLSWSFIVFPLWVLMMSIYIFFDDPRARLAVRWLLGVNRRNATDATDDELIK